MILATGCVTTVLSTAHKSLADAGIRETINPASVAGCESKGLIAGLSPNGFKILDAGEWLVAEIKKRGGNAFLTDSQGLRIKSNELFGTGEVYFCPAAPSAAPAPPSSP